MAIDGLPADVQIGPYRYTIVLDKPLTDAANCYGRVVHGKQTIWLDPDQGRTHLAATLLHEVLHGIFHVTNNGDFENEEKVVIALTSSLLDTLRRNPTLVTFLMDDDDAAT